MLPKNYRATKEEITRTATRGKRINKSGYYLRIWWDDELENSKFGIIVPKKVVKKATKRNEVKRKFRNWVYGEIKKNKFERLGVYVFILSAEDYEL